MRKFNSIKIIHDIVHRADYVFLSEFFRFIGIFVCEGILFEKNDRTEAEKNAKYDIWVFVGEKELSSSGAGELLNQITDNTEYSKLIGSLPSQTIFFPPVCGEAGGTDILAIMNESDQRQQESLKLLMEKISYMIFEKIDRDALDFDGLINIYVKNRIVLSSINLQYFQGKPSLAVRESRDSLIKACEGLQCLSMEERFRGEMDSYYRYAVLWTKVKANLASKYEREKLFAFPIEELADECYQLSADYPDFANAIVLLGLCHEPFRNRVNSALSAFSTALKFIDNNCFSAPIYYWMGKWYEDTRQMPRQTKMSYERANKKKEKFRTIFKLAVIARDEGDYRKALELFNTILMRLKSKSAIRFEDPLEIEYIFKTQNQQCNIYYKMHEYTKVIELGEKTLDLLREETVDQNKYFSVVYGKDVDKYKKILIEKLKPNLLYHLLSESYAKMGNPEKASEYRKLEEENES